MRILPITMLSIRLVSTVLYSKLLYSCSKYFLVLVKQHVEWHQSEFEDLFSAVFHNDSLLMPCVLMFLFIFYVKAKVPSTLVLFQISIRVLLIIVPGYPE